jgi:hypothetical protein
VAINSKYIQRLGKKSVYTPAEWVIYQFQGVRPLARALDRDPSTVARWVLRAKQKGHDGRVPGAHHSDILRIAQKQHLDITASDLISGRTRSRRAA